MADPKDDLVAHARDGDPAARARLLERLESTVHQIVKRRMGRRLRLRVESVDVVQSALGDALRDLDGFRGEGEQALLRWLTRIVENKLRRRAREMQYGDRDPDRVRQVQPANSEAPGCEPPSDATGVLTTLARADERDTLRAALARLPARERQLIELRDLQGLAWTQIVARAGEPSEKAAQNRYARARVRLTALLHPGQGSD